MTVSQHLHKKLRCWYLPSIQSSKPTWLLPLKTGSRGKELWVPCMPILVQSIPLMNFNQQPNLWRRDSWWSSILLSNCIPLNISGRFYHIARIFVRMLIWAKPQATVYVNRQVSEAHGDLDNKHEIWGLYRALAGLWYYWSVFALKIALLLPPFQGEFDLRGMLWESMLNSGSFPKNTTNALSTESMEAMKPALSIRELPNNIEALTLLVSWKGPSLINWEWPCWPKQQIWWQFVYISEN